eukprot:m.304264 g.304264  ORF g.304264 m.304264 type:complete len:798 (+) comp55267_c0_seq5:1116-3509(+)
MSSNENMGDAQFPDSASQHASSQPLDAALSVDETGNIISWSEAASKIYGYSTEEILGTSLHLLMPESFRQKHRAVFEARVREQQKSKSKVVRHNSIYKGHSVRKSGEEFPAEVAVSSYTVKGQLRFTGVIRDLSSVNPEGLQVSISDVIAERKKRQALSFGASMQTTHRLASDQHITQLELKTLLLANLKENKLELDEAKRELKASMICNALLLEGSRDGARIDFIDLLPILAKHGLDIDDAGSLRISNEYLAEVLTRWQKLRSWFRAEFGSVLDVSLLAFLTSVIFGVVLRDHILVLEDSISLSVARAAGTAVAFNSAVLLLPMCRLTLSYLRRTFVVNFTPLDSAIQFHKLIAWVVLGLSIIHTVAHLVHWGEIGEDLGSMIFDTNAGLTGFFIWIFLIVIFVGASKSIRRAGEAARAGNAIKAAIFSHSVFFFSHHFFILYFVVLLIHSNSYWSPSFWKFVLGPGVLYSAERAYREFYRKSAPLKVVRGVALPGGVTHLQITKPPGYKTTPGQYIFLQLPMISTFEWHPFTLSSAPGDKYISVHIRTAGDWTGDVFNYFSKFPVSNALMGEVGMQSLPDARIDGPYGTANSEVFGYSHAVLIGAGVGATPTTSILKHIKHRFESKAGCQTPNCTCKCDCCLFRIQKLYVVWTSRDVEGFKWFAQYLSELQLDESRRVRQAQEKGEIYEPLIDIRVFLTSVAQRKDDLTQVLFQVGIEQAQQAQELDVLTSLRSATKFGRPNFDAIFRELEERHPTKRIGVFYCGPPEMGGSIRKSCLASSARGVCEFDYKFEIP